MATDEATREYSAPIRELGDKIVELTLKQAMELKHYLQDEHGIEAAAGAPVIIAPTDGGGAAAAEEEKTEFDVVLEDFGGKEKKIGVIKVVRAATALGLKEAKEKVEAIPSKIKEGISKEDAEKLKKDLEEAGATVSIK